MNNGVDAGNGNTISAEPKESNTETQDRYSALRFAVSKKNRPVTPMPRKMRRYNVVRHKNGVSTVQVDISQIMANKLRDQYRRQGFTVDLLEQSSLSGEVIRSAPSTAKIPCPTPYLTLSQKAKDQVLANKLASWRASRMSRENAKLNAKKDRNKSYVYVSGNLAFAGDVDLAIEFVMQRAEMDWVIYLPARIWKLLGEVVNA